MTFNKAAIDVISKGLDPCHPHKILGHDGLLAVPIPAAIKEEKPLSATSVADLESSVPVPLLLSEKEEELGKPPITVVDAKNQTSTEEEIVSPEQTIKPVAAKTGKRLPPVRTSKVPQ